MATDVFFGIFMTKVIGFLIGGCPIGGGGTLGNPEDSGREDWGTLGKIRGITTPPVRILLKSAENWPSVLVTDRTAPSKRKGSDEMMGWDVSDHCFLL